MLLRFTASSYMFKIGFSAMIGINSKFRSKQQLSNILRLKLIHLSCLLKYALQADGSRKISVFDTGHSP
ncbi:hypothetical protein T02_10039 [Trichinella nativa]|uniref:Uncharacterized protein n=1 Tax=Trichinella nativa TaxID=6335 RepID=A0A0V1KQQ5_9BILA|nr:hypothetical protein T02_10039 [Trichinella nativa]